MITNFEVTGLRLPACVAAVEQLSLLMQSVSVHPESLCLEAHFKNIESLKSLAVQVPSSRYACYCWKRIESGTEFRRAEFKSLGKARLNFARQSVSIDRQPSLPPYDWNGQPNPVTNLAYIERCEEPIQERREPGKQTSRDIAAMVIDISGGDAAEVRTSTTRSGSVREHWYWVQLPTESVGDFLEALFDRFRLQIGVGTFEFLGSAAHINAICQESKYAFDDFPGNCWSFNAAVGRTPFALECGSFQCPVVNIGREQLTVVASQLDELTQHLTRCSMTRKYLPWNLGKGRFSPRTQGNYAVISRQKAGYLMFAGFEQYADGDPSVKQFTASVTPILEQIGMGLKKVPYIK